MIIELDETGSVPELRRLLEQTASDERVQSILVLAADANEFTPEQVDPILTALSVPVFGGTFPEVLHGEQKLGRGTVVVGLPQRARVATVAELSREDADYEEAIDQALGEPGDATTMFVFVDGFAGRIAALIESLFDVYGLELNYIGGGAGSLSFVPKPCLFTNAGLVYDAAVLALIELSSGVGVSHGWQEVRGPFQVTGSKGNTIVTLDGKPAAEVYAEVVAERTGQALTKDGFFDLAKRFPFGISKLGAEKVVRDPISMEDDGSLVCVGDVPQGSFVHILTGDVEALVSAAGQALSLGQAAFPQGEPQRVTLFIDCISRGLVLGDDFGRELNVVQQPSVPLVGALTLGEIANSGKDYLEFYNKTSVVGVLG